MLSEFLYSGGKGEKIPKVLPQPQILDDIAEELKYREWLPVYSMRAACGKFGNNETVSMEGWMDATALHRTGRNENLFIVKAVGHSMEQDIHDGQYVVFEDRHGEFADGDIVLAQHAPYHDAETGGAYSIKKIAAPAAKGEAAAERKYESITLKPSNPAYEPISIPDEGEFGTDYKIVGVLKGKL